MKQEKYSGGGVIAVFVEGLESTPGWVALSRKKQDELLEHTSHIQQNRQLQKLGEFGELLELYRVQQLLEGEEMQMRDYVQRLYPEHTRRTVNRKLEVFSQIVPRIPEGVLKRLVVAGGEMLDRFERISKAYLGDISNAVKQLPMLTANTEKAAEGYLERLENKLYEDRRRRRDGVALHKEKEFAAKMATNSLIGYMRACGLKSSAENRAFLKEVVGWTMEARGIPGSMEIKRLPIPEGIIIRRGRPRKKPLKEAA